MEEKTEKIKNVIDLALNNFHPSIPEVVIWEPYITKILNIYTTNEESYIQEMSKKFIVFPLNYNKEYSFRGITHFHDNPKSTEKLF